MKKNKMGYAALALVIGLALVFGLLTGCEKKADEIVVMGTTNFDDLVLSGDLTVGDGATIADDLAVSGDMSVVGTASWGCSNTTITDTLTVQDVVITDTLNASGNVTIAGTLDVAGNVASATGAFTVADSIDIAGDIVMENDETLSNAIDDEVSIWIGGAEEYSATATGLYLNGNNLYLDADVDTYFDTAIDDEISMFIGGAEEYSATATGFFLNGNALYMDADVDTILTNSLDDYITMTLGAAAGQFAVTTGNVKIGDGVESLTLNGEDLYVEGTFEADGSARFDGGIALATGELVISNGLFLPDTDDLTVSDGDWVTPTLLNVYSLDASGDVTFTLGTTTNDGQSLTLSADDNHRYCLNATNLRTTDGGEIVFGQYDVLVFVANDEEWLLVSNSGNQ